MARTDLERRLRGLTHVAQLLNDGEEARARIHAVLLAFPEISPDGMAKLVRATELQKYNPDWPDEPRVPAGNPDGGQWTTDGDSSFVETVVSEHELAMSPECMEEWAAARLFCTNLLTAGLLGKRGYLGFGRTYDQCVRGQVSAACGGNPIG
ncbi:MAG TPA: hypothetical protein VN802_00825 [Stellaceae bacterium]|nr:hypothetical protein [Stellaceae bacterium]